MSTVTPQPRMAAEERRKQLIETAIDLFSQKGFGGTTTKEIAAAAGVTEAIIFRHFATKQDFYKAILDYKCNRSGADDWFAETQAFMDANDDEGLFRLLLAKIIGFNRDEPRFARLLMHAALEGHELAILHHTQMTLPIGAKFKEYIAKRQAAGEIKECNPALVIFALAGIAQYYALQKYVYQGGNIPYSDEEMIDGFLAIVMDGLRAPSKRKAK